MSTAGGEGKREVVQARVVADEHHRTNGLGKCSELFEQFLFRGAVKLRDDLDRATLAE
jgi:hypothetical protein